MNKYIKLLLERIFDDSDIITDDTEDISSDISNGIIKLKIREFSNVEYNNTVYPDNFTDISSGEILCELGSLLISSVYDRVWSGEKGKYYFICEFPNSSNGLKYNKLSICTGIGNTNLHKVLYIFDVYLTDKHIHYIQYNEPYRLFVTLHENILYEIQFTDIFHELFEHGFTIDEIRLSPNYKSMPWKLKEIIFEGNGKRDSYYITSDDIKKFPVFTIPTEAENPEFVNINTLKSKLTIEFGYMFICDTLETFYNLLEYWKKQGFKKFRMLHQTGIKDASIGFNGIYDSEELFSKFMIDNNFIRYSFSDKGNLINVIYQKTELYCKENYGYIPSESFSYSYSFGEKGTDKEYGLFIKILIKPEFYVDKTYKYYTFNWKFYKSGLCKLLDIKDLNKWKW